MSKVTLVIGGIFAAIGIVCYVSTIGQPHSEAIVATASFFFSMGVLVISSALYIRGRRLQGEHQQQIVMVKKTDRLCSSCNREPAQVFCRVHVLRLCSNCIDRHDDGKNCLYVPAKRAAAAYK